MGTAISKEQKRLLLGVACAFAVGALSTWILIGAEPGSRADWVAAAGTWVIGYGAVAIAWRAGQREEADQQEGRDLSRKEELASLFIVLSIARRVVSATENAIEYFSDDDKTGLPRRATLWVLSRLISRMDEVRSRDPALSVLSESDQELVFDMEEGVSWVRAVATDFANEINDDVNLAVKGHYSAGHLVEAAKRLKGISERLIESTTQRRTQLNLQAGSHSAP